MTNKKGERIIEKVLTGQNDTNIDLGGCASGVYLIRVIQGNMAGTKKLIIH